MVKRRFQRGFSGRMQQGSASLVLPPLPVGVEAKAFGVTIERAEGAATPTLPIILAGAAPSS